MKTFTKLVATVAAIFICLGLVMGVAALAWGATWDGLGWSWGRGWGWSWGIGTESFSGEYEGVTSLDFDLNMAEVVIKEGDTFSIEAKNLYTKITSRVENGVWKIDTEERRFNRFFGIHLDDAVITITLPRGFAADELKLNLGMGSLKSDALAADEIDLEVGMGEVNLKKLVSPVIKLKAGMGSINVKNVETAKATLDCGMGSINITVSGSQEDYGYRAKVGMGSISIGSQRLSGMGGEQQHNTSADKMLDVECGMGSIDINFD